MARPLRITYEGALYHITSRGNEKNPIYRDNGDYLRFLEILSELPQRYSILIHGYVLMGNHYHLLIETLKSNITNVMHYLNTTYTGYFNRKYKRAGHLFQGRYRGFLIEKEKYLLSVSRYIHLNPVRASMVRKLEEYRWSSYLEYAGIQQKSDWLTCDWILGQFSKYEARAKRLYKRFVDEGMREKEFPFSFLKGGLILGSETFIEKVKRKVTLKRHREIPETRKLTRRIGYEDIIGVVGRGLKVSEQEIISGRRDNLAKKITLYLLRRHTDMRNEEIARYFGIGYTAVSQASLRLKREVEKNIKIKKIVEEMEEGLLSEV